MRAAAPYAAAATALVAVDQVVKWMVETHLPYENAIPVAPMLSLYRTWNRGISFSLLEGFGPAALAGLALLVTVFVLFLATRTQPHEKAARLGYAMIVAGAVGNLIDRVAYGHVVDYILFHTQNWAFSVINLADACISVGAALVVLQEVLNFGRDRSRPAGD